DACAPPTENRTLVMQKSLASSLASSSGGPTLCKRDHARFVVGPVVKNGRVEVGTVRPDERMNFVIDGDSVELIEVAQWTVELAFENRPEVDRPDQPVSKLDPETI